MDEPAVVSSGASDAVQLATLARVIAVSQLLETRVVVVQPTEPEPPPPLLPHEYTKRELRELGQGDHTPGPPVDFLRLPVAAYDASAASRIREERATRKAANFKKRNSNV